MLYRYSICPNFYAGPRLAVGGVYAADHATARDAAERFLRDAGASEELMREYHVQSWACWGPFVPGRPDLPLAG